MRRAAPVRPVLAPGAVPPEIAVGPLVEVWGDPRDAFSWTATRARWKAARAAWLAAAGISDHDSWEVIPARSWWSVERLDERGQRAEADARLLERAQVTRDDLPALRRAAAAWAARP